MHRPYEERYTRGSLVPDGVFVPQEDGMRFEALPIELGVLVPIIASLILARQGTLRSRRLGLLVCGCALISLGFMAWAASLSC